MVRSKTEGDQRRWTRTYDVSEVTSLSRIKKEKVIQTGKAWSLAH
jgi:hypothetical protein